MKENEADKIKAEELSEKIKNSATASPADIEHLNKIEERIATRSESLAPQAPRTNVIPRVFIHIGNESQRANMTKFVEVIKSMGFSAPGIELIKNSGALPSNPNVRYFNDDDAEAASQVVDQLKVNGYPTAYPYRVKGMKARSGTLEVWLTAN